MRKTRFLDLLQYAKSNPRQGIILLVFGTAGIFVLGLAERWIGAWADDFLMRHTGLLSTATIGLVEFVARHPVWSILGFSFSVVLGHLIHAYWATHPFHSWHGPNAKKYQRENATDLKRESATSESSMPLARPKIYPTAFGENARDRRSGLFIRNDGEAAFDVTVHDVPFGTAKLQFWSVVPVLTKDKGDVLVEGHIELQRGSGTFATALMGQMVAFDLPDIPVKITYKDADNNWYATECKLERDVLTRGSGIAVKYIAQRPCSKPLSDNGTKSTGIWPVPDVSLTWDLSEEKRNARLLDPEIEKDILIHNRSDKYVYNVQIHPVPLHQELVFDLINEIAPGKQHPTLGRWDGKSSLTVKWAHYFCNQHNAEAAFKQGWILDKTHQRGLSSQFYKIPMAITYDCDGFKYKAEFEFIYDIGDESLFVKKSAWRL